MPSTTNGRSRRTCCGFKLTDRRAIPDAEADLASILAAFESQDWARVYRWTLLGRPLRNDGGHFIAARTQVTLTMSSGRTVIADASLIWEDDRWALLSIAPRP